MGGRLHHLGVLAQHSPGVLRRVWLPANPAFGDLIFGDRNIEGVTGHIEGDLVAISQEGDRAPINCLGGDVSHTEPGGASREAAVRDEQDVLAQHP